jgi:hypothetical protein
MSAIFRSFRRLGPATLTLATFALAACAVAQDPDETGNESSGSTPSVSGGGSSASGATSGGAPASGGKPAATGGTPSTTTSGGKPNSSSGGAPAGGAATTTGGVAATGGTTAGTCPPYTGTLAMDSTIFTAGFGQSTTGMWSGYGYSYKYGAATVTPGTGNNCFSAMKFCANGSVPADDLSGAGLGWNISQVRGAPTPMKAPITSPIKLTVAGMTAGMRVQLSATSELSYCYTITAADAAAGTVTIPAASFQTDCWGTEGAAYDLATPIEAIQIAVPGSTAGPAKAFDFCVVDIEPG